MQAGAGNVAVTRFAQQARLLRNHKKYKNEGGYGQLQNDKERELYGALRDAGFSEDDIAVAGPGTALADLVACDGERLWLVEVKGDVAWLGKDNQTLTGNTPAKQLGRKLLGMRKKKLNVDRVQVTIDEYLGPPLGDEGRANLSLTVTHLDQEDALLAIETIVGDPKEPKFYPTTIHQVLKFLDETIKETTGFKDEVAEKINPWVSTAMELIASYKAWEGEPADWMASNGGMLENVYTSFREATMHKQPHAELKQLDAKLGVNVTLLPVTRAVPKVDRRAVLARTRFKDVGAASTWLKTAPARDADEEDDAYATRILLDGEYGVEADFYANYGLLLKAFGLATVPAAAERPVPNVPKKRTVPPKVWEHIVNGTYVAKEDKVTGLHTIHGNRPTARGTGDKKTFGTKGCYRQAVEYWDSEAEKKGDSDEEEKAPVKAPTKPVKTKQKKHESSFYPDEWTLEDIRDAIEYAAARDGQRFDVMWPTKGIGIQLWFNGESYFPYTSD